MLRRMVARPAGANAQGKQIGNKKKLQISKCEIHVPHTVAANTINVDIISPKLEMTVSRADDMLCNG